ncbi:nucleotide-diphospho-sugar transferase [Aspergillus avenaceus]|uniref:Nucleotide-diphospho-sugar transferase n=1 Tax=Aspergillus avenaceus TaxID=36643 RepID=A0A5N6U0U2_ASPAV|nr:nucleotide-diphospho-sugar transferase [Aspergillus avenaceus]
MSLITSRALRLAFAILATLLFAIILWLPKDSIRNVHDITLPARHSRISVNWSRSAYVQYVTNTAYLCNSVMIFEALHRFGSKADRLMMYPSGFSLDGTSVESKLLRKAQGQYGVKLMPIQVQSKEDRDSTWAESYTKLLAFNQTQYDRVLSLDSDVTLLQPMDELFLLPPCPVAMPRAYWLNFDDRVLTSLLMLVQPSDFDALVIPHRPYSMLTGEFRSKRHADYLGNPLETWDPERAFEEAKLVHFSDWPVPKPWIQIPTSTMDEQKPTCDNNNQTAVEDCRARDIWLGLYSDFIKRRQNICGMAAEETANDH